MASIFKQQYTTKVKDPKTDTEKRVRKKSAFWYIDYKGPGGIRKRVKAFKDKTATAQLAAKLEKEAELEDSGIIDRFKEHRKHPLKKHLTEWRDSLRTCGVTEKQVNQNYSRALRIFTESGFCFWQDISASKMMQIIDRLQTLVCRKNKQTGKIEMQKTGPASSITKRHHLRAVKQFSKWMVADGRVPFSPLEHLTRSAQVENPKRALSVAEIQVLLEYTTTAGTNYNVSGTERALIYRFAIETGLRAEEINSLKRPSFDFEARTVRLMGKHAKNRKNALLPLRMFTIERIQDHLSAKMPNARAFRIPSGKTYCNAGRMLKKDLGKARAAWIETVKDNPEEHRQRVESDFLKIKTPEGKLDFHALRHTCSSLLRAC